MAESGGLLRQDDSATHAAAEASTLTGRTFVVFADDWGRHPSSCQHLFRRLAPVNRVLWVNTIGTRTPTLSRSDLARAWGKLREWTLPRRSRAEAGPGPPVKVLRPFMIPFESWPGVSALNAHLVGRCVRRELDGAPGRGPIVVSTIPNVARVVGELGAELSVYYCVDEFSEWPGADRETMLRMEWELLGKVDLVLATAGTLFDSKSQHHARVRLLRHGVDWERFRAGKGEAPAQLRTLPRPVVGFIGLLDERLDVALIASLARDIPEASFVFVGPRQLPACELDGIPNVHFLPAVPYDDVPAVLHRFDVALLPYVVSELTERINPLKLRELLASGVPIVATALPEVERFGDVLRMPVGLDEWRSAIWAAAKEGRAHAEERAQSVRGESWERRAEEFSRHCREAERARGGTS